MDLPNLSNTVTAAIIAGAFALVGQSLVKVWEVRQRRRDELAKIYSERLDAVRHCAQATIRYDQQATILRQRRANLNLRKFALTSQMYSTMDAIAGTNVEELRSGVHKAEIEESKRADEFQTALRVLRASDSLFTLYARAPLRRQNQRLTEELDQVLIKDTSSAALVEHASLSWARVARWELSAVGGVALSVVAYWFLTILTLIRFNPMTAWVSDKRYDARIKKNPPPLEASGDNSPPGAGHQGTDNQPTSETQGDSDGSIDNGEPGSPSGDRQ